MADQHTPAQQRPGQVPLRVPKGKLALVWQAARKKFRETAANATFGTAGAEIAGFPFGFAAVSALGTLGVALTAEDDSPEALAHEWVCTALYLSIVQQAGKLAKGDAGRLQDGIELRAEDAVIDAAFFHEPRRLPLIDQARHALADLLGGPFGDRDDAYDRLDDFPAAFIAHMHALYAEKQDRFDKVINATRGPFAEAWGRMAAWAKYDREVIVQQEWGAPIFDEDFSLAQVYVPLRAGVRPQIKQPRRKKSFLDLPSMPGGEDEPSPEWSANKKAVDLGKHFSHWLHQDDVDDPIRLIAGGPGCGKSSFMKWLAAETVRRRDGPDAWHVLFIRLQHLHFKNDLTAALTDYPGIDPLEALEPATAARPQPPLLLLFDGLDELAPETSETAATLSRDFFEAAGRLLERLHGQGRKARAVIAGRSKVMEAAFGNLSAIQRHHLFEVAPYHLCEDDLKEYEEDPPDFLTDDQRPLAWSKYAAAIGEPEAEPPAVLTPSHDERFHDLSKEPLLHCFIVLGREELRALDLATVSRNTIYKALFDRLFRRDLDDGRKPARHFAGDGEDVVRDEATIRARYYQALECIALAAWRGGTERIAEHRLIREELETEELGHLLDRMPNGLPGLLASFFTRQPGDAPLRESAEFTHKSFAEYLYARRLARQAGRLAEAPVGRNQRERAQDEHDRLAEWVRITADHRMTVDVLEWLRAELVEQAGPNRDAWHAALTPHLVTLTRDGWRDHPEGTTQREAEARSVNAEEALFCAWQALWQPTEMVADPADYDSDADMPDEDEGRYWRFPHEGRRGLHRLRRRLEAVHGRYFRPPFFNSLSGCHLGSNSLEGNNAVLGGADFSGAYLEYASFRFANLFYANLSKTNLSYVDLQGANLKYADLRGADLYSAFLSNANLSGAKFSKHPKNLGAIWLRDFPPRNLDKIIIDPN